jgi:hypothetical protein
MLCARERSMKAKNLDDVLVYRKALMAADEVSALLTRPAFDKDFDPRSKVEDIWLTPQESASSEFEAASIDEKYIEIGKMLTPWINYLQRCNWRIRGQRFEDETAFGKP